MAGRCGAGGKGCGFWTVWGFSEE